MFNSISNNFGAGQITFKDYLATNYIVLNAKVTFDPTNPDYQACDQLEITVPDLTIDRRTIGGVFVRFEETQHYSWGDSVYDGGSVLKSWIKDRNTIVVEKQPWFDNNGPLTAVFRHDVRAAQSWNQRHQGNQAASYGHHRRQLLAVLQRHFRGCL